MVSALLVFGILFFTTYTFAMYMEHFYLLGNTHDMYNTSHLEPGLITQIIVTCVLWSAGVMLVVSGVAFSPNVYYASENMLPCYVPSEKLDGTQDFRAKVRCSHAGPLCFIIGCCLLGFWGGTLMLIPDKLKITMFREKHLGDVVPAALVMTAMLAFVELYIQTTALSFYMKVALTQWLECLVSSYLQ